MPTKISIKNYNYTILLYNYIVLLNYLNMILLKVINDHVKRLKTHTCFIIFFSTVPNTLYAGARYKLFNISDINIVNTHILLRGGNELSDYVNEHLFPFTFSFKKYKNDYMLTYACIKCAYRKPTLLFVKSLYIYDLLFACEKFVCHLL